MGGIFHYPTLFKLSLSATLLASLRLDSTQNAQETALLFELMNGARIRLTFIKLEELYSTIWFRLLSIPNEV